MPGRNVTGMFRVVFLSLLITVTAFLWPFTVDRAEARADVDTVRVCIAQQMPGVSLSFQGRYRLVDALTGDMIAETGAGETWTLSNVGGFTVLQKNGRDYDVFRGAVRAEEFNQRQSIVSGDGRMVQEDSLSGLAVISAGGVRYLERPNEVRVVDGSGAIRQVYQGGQNLFGLEKNGRVHRYRGNVEIRPAGVGFNVINELPVEHYLYGVVPSEMPVSFPAEALKAQAVAARSYVLSQLGNYGSQGFDVLDNQQSQIYKGFDGEHALVSRAVDETAGQVLCYRGQPINAFFHASSGGYTENCEDVWRDTLAYIRTREDPADFNNKYYNWVVSYPVDRLTTLVNEGIKRYNIPGPAATFAEVTDLRELERTASGQRVKRLLIQGLDPAGNPLQVEVNNADRVRGVLGLNSALFTMRKETDARGRLHNVVLTGSGMGHGLGMSQWGAAGMALKGYNYQDILQYYYTGVDLVGNYGNQ